MTRLRAAVDGWQRFWFEPESTATIAIVRIAFGAVTTLWFATLIPTLLVFFGPDGMLLARPQLAPWTWTLLTLASGRPVLLVVLWLLALLSAVALTVGYRTRLAALLVFVGLMSFTRQMPLAINGGDMLMRTLSFYIVLAPAGAALSVDRWRKARNRFWECPVSAPWVLRLMQIQLSVVYLSTVWEKTAGASWRDGTALSYALRLVDLQRFAAPSFVTDSVWFMQLMTFGALGLELAIGVLVWNRVARPWVLGLGVLLHLSINVAIAVGFFSLTILTLYLAFLSPHASERLVGDVRDRVTGRRPARSRQGRVAHGVGHERSGRGVVPKRRVPKMREPVGDAPPDRGPEGADAARLAPTSGRPEQPAEQGERGGRQGAARAASPAP